MTPLRKKMITLMVFRQFAPKTHKAYLGAVIKLSTYYHRSPEEISAEEVKQWLIKTAAERTWSASTVHQTLMALKFCYHQVMGKTDFIFDIPLPKKPQRIPVLLTQKEVYEILHSTRNIKHLTILSVCYGCGLRVSEVVALTQNDIDSERLLLRVVQGKGKKDRNIPLSLSLLHLLRYYWQTWHPGHYLFNSTQKQKKTLSVSSVQKMFYQAKSDAGIHKEGGIHGLRHAYATHQLEHGLPIHQLQQFLGHSDVRITMKYLHWVPLTQVMASDLLEHFIPSALTMKKNRSRRMNVFKGTSTDMAEIVRTFLPDYRQRFQLTPEQASACQSILQCQTEALGGEYRQCTVCGYEQTLYHSCGNRHCPLCKQKASEKWEEKQLAALLPVRYYHLVFTLPHELNAWCQLHPKELYSLLFKAIWQTLSKFSFSHKRLQGELGITCVLHTWGQNLQQHIHMHCLIPGIALKPGKNAIETTQSDYLYPIEALKKVFRGKMVSLLRAAWKQGELFRITRANEVNQVLDTVMSKTWSIYIKPYLDNPETVVKYLARYTYRIAISNYRIIKIEQGKVYFHWKDYADNNKKKIMKLDGVEFLRRFLMHVLPSGFMRIRHYGFLANCVRKVRVEQLRKLLKEAGKLLKKVIFTKPKKLDKSACRCPSCKQGTMEIIYQFLSSKYRRWQFEVSERIKIAA